MARKKITTVVTEKDDEESLPHLLDDRPVETADEGERDAIDELKSLGGDDSIRWTVKRVAGKPGDPTGYCATYTAGTLSLDAIRESFGGGRYQIKGTNAAGQYKGSTTVEIIDLPKPPPPPATSPASQLGELAALMRDRAEPTDSPMLALVMKMIESQGLMMQAMMNRPAEKSAGLTDILALINATKPQESSGESAVKLLLQGLELGKELGGNAETGMLDVADKALGMLGPMMSRQAPAPAALPAPAPRPALPAIAAPARPINNNKPAPGTVPAKPAPSPANGADHTHEESPMLKQLNWLTAYLKTLVYQAARDSDPELYAAVMLDNLPEFISAEDLFERVRKDDALDELATLNAGVTQYRPWFEEFKTALIAQLTEEEPDENGAESETAHIPDALPGGEDLA